MKNINNLWSFRKIIKASKFVRKLVCDIEKLTINNSKSFAQCGISKYKISRVKGKE